MNKLQSLVMAVAVIVAAVGITNANRPPKQPILHGPDGLFRCGRESEAWAHFASRPDTTPNDADVWLAAWRARGGGCQ